MDPEANIREQRAIRHRLGCAKCKAAKYRASKARLKELQDALYRWIQSGGFRPASMDVDSGPGSECPAL